MLPPDTTWLDRIALAVFVVGWLGYGPFIHAFRTRPSITSRMNDVRRAWIFAMLGRENRITDASLLGNTMQSGTFFASTTMIALAALMGMLGRFDATYAVLQELHFTVKTTATFVEAKIMLLMLVFAYSFLKLSWALRQLNYCLALIGGAPLQPGPAEREAIAERDSVVLSLAIASFNAGIRGYYFALAALAWFMGPAAFLAVTCGMLGMLLWRQFGSATSAAIAAAHPHYARAHRASPAAGSPGAAGSAMWCAAIQPKVMAGPNVMPPPG